MTEPEYWSIISLGKYHQRVRHGDLYQCIMNTGMFELSGYKVTVGSYKKILYESGSLNSKIFVRTLNSEMTDAHVRIISSFSEAREYFSYLTDRDQHNDGYWELLGSTHFHQAYEKIICFSFVWRVCNPKTEEVDWMKEGF